MASSNHLQRLLPRLQHQFASLSPADGLFTLLTQQQSQRAWSSFPEQKNNREAAILVPIIQLHDEIHLVFTKRSSSMRSHSAEISFPGGGRDERDVTLVDTALRETQEELLHPANFLWTTIGVCAPVPSISGIPVTSVLAMHTSPLTCLETVFPGSPDEVDRVFSVALETLLEVETSKPLGRLGTPAPVFVVQGEEIWGLTAFVLRPLLHKVLKPILVEDRNPIKLEN